MSLDDDPSASFTVRVEAVRTVADDVVELALVAPDGSPLPGWEPGAHLDLHLAEGLVRQYSLTGDPADTSRYRIAVLREPAGRGGSAHVHTQVRAGDELTCRGPRNNFTLIPAKGYRFVAGGIGITPLVPMIEHAERARTPWRLSYFGRTRTAMAYADELLARHPERVEVRPDDVLDLPDLAATLCGLADGELVYACGPHGLLDALTGHLAEGRPGVLHLERFAPADAAALVADRDAFGVTLQRSGLELEVPADKSILEVMEEHGIPVVSSCREGTCGTCETAVISGQVDHRDSILSEEEKRETETMMICCSRGIGRGLVIDA
jgi:ferredoxin-NADP reductase